jgi:hypothetical protein
MASVIEVVNGISQAVHAKHHGGAEVGLRREYDSLVQGCSVHDTRVMDGFGIQFHGDKLVVKYNSEVPLQEVHDKNFETEIRRLMKSISEFIKSEYKKVTKDTLRLTEHGDIQVFVQTVNRRTAVVTANQMYEIGNLKDLKVQQKMASDEASFEDVAKRWLLNLKK